MYTKNDFPVGSKARVIATGGIWPIVDHVSDKVVKCLTVSGNILSINISELEPVFEYGDDVEVWRFEGGKKYKAIYGCYVPANDMRRIKGYNHICFSDENSSIIWVFCRRASSRKSELLKQLEQAREEERKAVEKREELEKELEKIK